jgi:hypothetical protein
VASAHEGHFYLVRALFSTFERLEQDAQSVLVEFVLQGEVFLVAFDGEIVLFLLLIIISMRRYVNNLGLLVDDLLQTLDIHGHLQYTELLARGLQVVDNLLILYLKI